jgi:AraC-like DNA-binding protein
MMRAPTTSTTSEQARWPRIGGTPHPRLRSLLARDYAGFTDATTPSHGFVLPATAETCLILKLQDSRYRSPEFVSGVRRSSLVPEGACAPSYLEVWLAPLGAYVLLGMPLHHLSDQIVDLREVLGAASRRLAEQLREAPTWQQRFALVDEFLLRQAERGPRPCPEVDWAWRRLAATGGALPIGRLAAEVGWSNKHLIARFKQEIGLPPKLAARLIRFDRVTRRLTQCPPARWEQIAADSGYADQAHLIHDFREFTGATPTGLRTFPQAGGIVDRRSQSTVPRPGAAG